MVDVGESVDVVRFSFERAAPQPGTYRESMVRSCFHCPTSSAELEYNRMSPDSSPTNNIRLGGVSCATRYWANDPNSPPPRCSVREGHSCRCFRNL